MSGGAERLAQGYRGSSGHAVILGPGPRGGCDQAHRFV